MGNYDEILNHTDLVLLDIKQMDETSYQEMTGRSISHFQQFLQTLKKYQTPIWIRHVVIPGLTDSRTHMEKLQEYVASIPHVEKVELLPYHLLGINKYEVMGIPYSLSNVPAMDKEETAKLQKEFFGGYDHV